MTFDKLATEELVQKTSKALSEKGYQVFISDNKEDALKKIKELIPEGVSVMNGSSVTLEQIGYIDLLNSGEHKWIDLHKKVTEENDPAKRSQLRKEAELSDFYVGSVNALTEDGEFVIGSNTGSQLPHIVFTSKNLIFVVSTQKIVTTFKDAMDRLESYVKPLEDKHLQEKYGKGTQLNKIVIFKGESLYLGRKVNFILVKEKLGF